MSDSPIQLLCGSSGSTYKIGPALGKGGMAQVYLAQRYGGARPPHSQPVALKLLRPSAPAQAQRLFYHEGWLLPRLHHAHVVRCVEHGRGAIPGVGPCDYLALDYIAGATVEQLLHQHGALAPALVLGIVAHVIDALGYLHQRGIVHCDLKPSNIMLRHATPQAVVIDFGIARAPDFVGQPAAVGTPQYMAPEQIDPQAHYDGRADLYALGVIIYELLTGKRLFPGRTTTDMRQGKLITLEIGAALDLLGAPTAQVLAGCLRADPRERYPCAAALFADLRQALGQAGANRAQRAAG